MESDLCPLGGAGDLFSHCALLVKTYFHWLTREQCNVILRFGEAIQEFLGREVAMVESPQPSFRAALFGRVPLPLLPASARGKR